MESREGWSHGKTMRRFAFDAEFHALVMMGLNAMRYGALYLPQAVKDMTAD